MCKAEHALLFLWSHLVVSLVHVIGLHILWGRPILFCSVLIQSLGLIQPKSLAVSP